jgi:hypothetical protein
VSAHSITVKSGAKRQTWLAEPIRRGWHWPAIAPP